MSLQISENTVTSNLMLTPADEQASRQSEARMTSDSCHKIACSNEFIFNEPLPGSEKVH